MWLSNLLTSSVPDEYYSERTWWMLFWAYLMNVILSVPDECYSERTWWMLFWAYLMNVVLSVPDECCSGRTWWMLFWAYPMNVVLSVPNECYSRNPSCALNLIFMFLLRSSILIILKLCSSENMNVPTY
jgi:hypothetical protein